MPLLFLGMTDEEFEAELERVRLAQEKRCPCGAWVPVIFSSCDHCNADLNGLCLPIRGKEGL